jgi:trk system potassium uptake protein
MQGYIHHNENLSQRYQLRPGDKIYRIPRIVPKHIVVPKIRTPRPIIGFSLLIFVYGFAAMIAVGTGFLMLPVSSNAGQFTPFITSLFTSTSAVCVTGLVVVDTMDHWSLFGQIVIMLLIQLGGLGFMTTTTVFMIAAGRKIGLRGRILVGESVGLTQIGGIVRLTRNILFFTLIAEAIGAIIFFTRFCSQYEWPLSLWKSVFQSVSAFNNAGFDLFGGFQSLTGHFNDYLVLLTTAALVILGGISFVVVNNIFRNRGIHHSSVDTKLVLLITLILLIAGTVVIFIAEYNNPQTMGNMPLPIKLLNSFFQSVTARTSGFNTINTGALTIYTLTFVMVLMFVGGASGSTAGGIKVNSLGMIFVIVWNTIRGRIYPKAFDREIPFEQIFRGITLLVLSLVLIVIVFFILSITETFPSIKILFETISAFGTVGLTTGITPDLSIFGKVVIIFLMFIGRLGPLTLTMALAKTQQISKYRYPKDSIRIG